MNPPKAPIIALEDVGISYSIRQGWFRYEKIWPLTGISFNIQPGETLGIIGRNGAGKTSLLHAIAGITKPCSGKVIRNTDSISLLSLNLGFVGNLTGRQNAILSGLLYGLSRAEIEKKLPAIQIFSELEEAFERPIDGYSAGMKARLGFSIAIKIDPEVLLIDEILGVGDISFREKSAEAMRKRLRSNKTAIFVSHILPEVNKLCNRVVWIEDGAIKMVGKPGPVIEKYRQYMQQDRIKKQEIARQQEAEINGG